MHIVLVASEVEPFASSSGKLSSVVRDLALGLSENGDEVSIFIPLYQRTCQLRATGKMIFDETDISFEVIIGSKNEPGSVLKSQLPDSNVTVYLIDNPVFFFREHLYGGDQGDYPDNAQRFIFFTRGVLETLKKLKIQPDIIQSFDWQTALLPIYLKSLYKDDFPDTASVLSIVDLTYQGLFWHMDMELTGLSWEYYNHHCLEFYGKLNFLKGGVTACDAITVASKHCADEVQSDQAGCGLEGLFLERRNSLYGILNGVNYDGWDPMLDKDIPAKFSADNLSEKKKCTGALKKELGLMENDKPLIGIVGPFNDTKGTDLFMASLRSILVDGAQIIAAGSGEPGYIEQLVNCAVEFRGDFVFQPLLEEGIKHRLYAGLDFLLVPSRQDSFNPEPALAMRYGVIPVVQKVGSLADMVSAGPDALEADPNGMSFEIPEKDTLIQTVKDAIAEWKNTSIREKMMKRIMQLEFTWATAAEKYQELYKKIQK